MTRLIDTHAHLDGVEDIETALAAARAAGVVAIVAVGTDAATNARGLDLAAKYPGFVFPALGLHPGDLGALDDAEVAATLACIEAHIGVAVAVGEIGLDYDKRVVRACPKPRQREALERLLALARRHDKPVSVHSRYAWRDAFDIVRASGVATAIFHWYTGLSSVLRDIIAAGYVISATPAAEYHEEHRRAVREAPLESLLLETDCPVTYGRTDRYRAAPADVVRSLRAVAAIKGLDVDVVAEATTANAARIFRLRLG